MPALFDHDFGGNSGDVSSVKMEVDKNKDKMTSHWFLLAKEATAIF